MAASMQNAKGIELLVSLASKLTSIRSSQNHGLHSVQIRCCRRIALHWDDQVTDRRSEWIVVHKIMGIHFSMELEFNTILQTAACCGD